MTTDLTTTTNRAVTSAADVASVAPTWDALVDMIAPSTGDGMIAASSARIYRDTFARWQAWAATQEDVTALGLTYKNVAAYLAALGQSKASRQRQLAALRKAAEVLAILDFNNPARRAAYESLKLLKVRNGSSAPAPTASAPTGTRRQRRALTPKEAEKALHVWDEPTDGVTAALAARNQAIVATLLATGLRRAELAALRWADVDFENGVITVAHGKGDKTRQAAIYGETGAALDALRAWQLVQPSGYAHVFTAVLKSGKVGPDAPLTTTALYNVVRDTADRAGIGKIAPHDLRRTLITELVATGAIHDAQAQAGHVNASTTLRYAVAVDARARRKAGRVRYG